jgi:membrane protease YdiL (CAAX protease family)
VDTTPTDFDGSPAGEVRPPTPPAPPAPPRKNGLRFFAVVLGLYSILGTAAQAANAVLGLVWSQVFALLLPAWIAASGSNLRPGRALLLARAPGVPAMVLAPLIGAAAFLGAGALMQLTSMLLPDRWLEVFDVSKLFERPPFERAALSLAAATMAPFCEEVAFRGWLLTALRTRYAPSGAAALSGLLFAVMHLDPVRFSALVALGVLYAWLTLRSGSVWPAVLAHAANNGLGLALARASGSATSLQALPRSREVALAAVSTLAIAGVALWLLALAYQHATPSPPPVDDALVRADTAETSVTFRLGRLTAGQLAAIAAGFVSLLGLAVLSLARHT